MPTINTEGKNRERLKMEVVRGGLCRIWKQAIASGTPLLPASCLGKRSGCFQSTQRHSVDAEAVQIESDCESTTGNKNSGGGGRRRVRERGMGWKEGRRRGVREGAGVGSAN